MKTNHLYYWQWLRQNPKIIFISIVMMYTLFVLIGSVEFNLWNQVIFLWEKEYEESADRWTGHVSRFLLVAPIFYVSELLNMHRDYLFSICIPLLLMASAYIMMQVMASVTLTPPSYWHSVLFYSVLVAISLFMNGRLVFVITGGSVLLGILSNMLEKNNNTDFLTKQFIGFWLISVSSGSYLTGFIFFYSIFAYYLFQKKIRFIRLSSLIKHMVLFCILLIQFYIFLMKNLTWAEGSIGNLLQHGTGSLLQEVSAYYWLVASVVTGAIVTQLFRQFHYASILIYVILIVAFGGLFGFSTLAIGVPALLVLSLIFVSRHLGSYK